jgi:hypothetical protein
MVAATTLSDKNHHLRATPMIFHSFCCKEDSLFALYPKTGSTCIFAVYQRENTFF